MLQVLLVSGVNIMTEIPSNYVRLKAGDTISMVFDHYNRISPSIKDPVLGFNKTVNALVFHVKELNGQPADTVYSIVSEKLQQEMLPYLDMDRYKRYRFTMTREAGEYSSPRILSATPI